MIKKLLSWIDFRERKWRHESPILYSGFFCESCGEFTQTRNTFQYKKRMCYECGKSVGIYDD